ncbi:nucleotidyltransferase domain-containing protein [Hamadaea sp. NPDC051192]|uniref:nucleotidyltransferase domain-containing protein n=1 Tax=Hamadaea sp. NPDC051192 TaxID=3154940 RepID=UPI00341DC902
MTRDELIDRLTAQLRADRRVQAAWLGGSLGRGAADQFSDVDLVVATDDPRAYAADWDAVADKVATVVHRQRMADATTTVVTHVTDDWLRFDVTITTPDRVRGQLRPLFGEPAVPADEPPSPDPARVEHLIREFLRVLGLLPVVLGRGEYAVGASGSGLLRTLILQVMLEDAVLQGAERAGALRLKGILPADRLAAYNALPSIEATRTSVVSAHLACSRLFLPVARELAERTGATWPDAMEQALRKHLRRELGIEIGP